MPGGGLIGTAAVPRRSSAPRASKLSRHEAAKRIDQAFIVHRLTPHFQKKRTKRDVFTQEEVQGLLNAAPSLERQPAIILGFFVGARLFDCVQMKWENVRPELGVIAYSQTKGKKDVIVPMHFHVIEHLNYLSQFNADGLLCPTLAKRVSGGRNGLSGAFKKIVLRAGIDPGIVDGKGVRKFTKRTFHSLRHSFTSALANAGVSEEVRMKLTGHTSKPVHHTYTQLELDTPKNAVKSLSSFA
ncbi:MAG: tyrosine-type recombinase/integrase [Verrucomicrobia bacterium]|nr:tyrosine-type recombinase/integrase [Verrucomicrobiota bacterium]